jgi:hypothetical protein
VAVDVAGVSGEAPLLAEPSHPDTVAKTRIAAATRTARLPTTSRIVDLYDGQLGPPPMWLS